MNRSTLMRRIEELERELAELRKALAGETPPPAEKEFRPTRGLNKEELRDSIDRAFQEMGVRARPIGAEKVQQLLLAGGVKPEENAFSREIVAMRGE